MNQRGGIAGMRMLQGGLFAAVLACATAPALWTQDAPSEAVPAPAAPTGPAVTVRGVVLNETTGQPVRRALVRVNSALGRRALTDGEGRFEIHGVTAGVQLFTVSKPGFQEQMGEDERQQSVVHSVRVAIGMPDLSLTLAPKNAIFGHVSLSTGTPALGIGVTLVRQTIEDGRAEWEQVEGHQTTPDGAFRMARIC
jgi:5-hydroxyisourate hydrolase-like protein (transthyretin family)